jgi:hypothetical protein
MQDELSSTMSDLWSLRERERQLSAEAESLRTAASVLQADKDELRFELERARR